MILKLTTPSKIVCCQDYQQLALVEILFNLPRVEFAIGRHVYAVAVGVERGQYDLLVSHLFRVNVRERLVAHIDAHGADSGLTFCGRPEPNCSESTVNVSIV